MDYDRGNNSKFLILYHIVLVTKYRRNILNLFNIKEIFIDILIRHYWKQRILWSDGYFITTVGNVNIEIIKKYIQNQQNK